MKRLDISAYTISTERASDRRNNNNLEGLRARLSIVGAGHKSVLRLGVLTLVGRALAFSDGTAQVIVALWLEKGG